MERIARFEELLKEYLEYSKLSYFVCAYKTVYNHIHMHIEREANYYSDYGRLWALYELIGDKMKNEDKNELRDLIINL